MSTPMLWAVLVIGPVVVILVVIGLTVFRKSRKPFKSTWEKLAGQIVPIDHRVIETVALDAIEPSGERRSDEQRRTLTRQQIWDLLGGMRGIRGMENNSRVLSEMADYFETQHPEAADLAYEIRLEARVLAWNTGWLHEAEKNKCLDVHFFLYGQNAAISYYRLSKKAKALTRRRDAADSIAG